MNTTTEGIGVICSLGHPVIGKLHRITRMFCRLTAALVLIAFLALPLAAIDGTFQGQVVNPPTSQPAVPGWIYVQGRNHMVRRVEVSHADIVFAEHVASRQKHKCNWECISPGQEIRVTAEQDRGGEWRAKRVEILKLTTDKV